MPRSDRGNASTPRTLDKPHKSEGQKAPMPPNHPNEGKAREDTHGRMQETLLPGSQPTPRRWQSRRRHRQPQIPEAAHPYKTRIPPSLPPTLSLSPSLPLGLPPHCPPQITSPSPYSLPHCLPHPLLPPVSFSLSLFSLSLSLLSCPGKVVKPHVRFCTSRPTLCLESSRGQWSGRYKTTYH